MDAIFTCQPGPQMNRCLERKRRVSTAKRRMNSSPETMAKCNVRGTIHGVVARRVDDEVPHYCPVHVQGEAIGEPPNGIKDAGMSPLDP